MTRFESNEPRLTRLIVVRISTAFLALIFCPPSLQAAPFSAICQDVVTHGYRSGTDFRGAPLEDEWTTDEMFNSEWKFQYDGKAAFVLIDGIEKRIVGQNGDVLIVLGDPMNAPLGASITTYVIHEGLQKVVISQVQGNSGLGNGVMGRVTNLQCEFSSPE